MKEIFQFWGYDPEAWDDLVGTGKLIELDPPAAVETRFGRLIFDEEAFDLLKEFEAEIHQGILSFIRFSAPPRQAGGKPMVSLEGTDPPQRIPLVTKTPAGQFRFHFDLDETLQFIQQEKYLSRRIPLYVKWGLSPDQFPRAVRKAALVGFGLSRFFLNGPRPRRNFPSFPKDFSVDLWRFFVKSLIERYGGKPYSTVPLWPGGKQYAVALTHDVDTVWGFKNRLGIDTFREMEEKRNLHSAWMIVTSLEPEGRVCLEELLKAGHEIGFHGVRHDHGLAYLPEPRIRDTLAPALSFLKKFQGVGFRSPSYHHSKALFRVLDSMIQYDTSLHDAFEDITSPLPQAQGCSTCFPFKIEGTNLLEIPTTVVEDLVLEIRGVSPAGALGYQIGVIEEIKKRQGVANLLTHPEPQLSSRPPWIENYEVLLEKLAQDPAAWIPLPRDLCQWWKERQGRISAAWQKTELPIL